MLKDIIQGDLQLDRRKLLGGLALASALPATSAMGMSGTKPEKLPGLSLPLDFSSPEMNLLAYVRLVGDSSGKPTFGWSHGRIYGTLEGELSTTLLDYISCRRVEFKKLDDGSWAQGYRGLILMTDPKTGKVIDNFRNPYTGEDNKIIHFKTAFGAAVFSVTGTRSLVSFESESPKDNGHKDTFVMPWSVVGDDAWATYDERVAYRRRDGAWRTDNAVYRYQTLLSELTNPEITSPSRNMMWSTELPWFTYMKMGERPGHLMWAGMGKKYNSLEDIPKYLVDEAERRYPGFLSTPIDWDEFHV